MWFYCNSTKNQNYKEYIRTLQKYTKHAQKEVVQFEQPLLFFIWLIIMD